MKILDIKHVRKITQDNLPDETIKEYIVDEIEKAMYLGKYEIYKKIDVTDLANYETVIKDLKEDGFKVHVTKLPFAIVAIIVNWQEDKKEEK